MRFAVEERLAGEPTLGYGLFCTAWEECVELQVQSQEYWVGSTLCMLTQHDRYEIGMFVDGVAVGGVVLMQDVDVHVGPCLSVVAQYVLPEYRNKSISLRCMAECMRIAKDSGAAVLAFTHRKGPWKYSTIYRRIK